MNTSHSPAPTVRSRLRRSAILVVVFVGYFAYGQRKDFVASYDPYIAVALPALAVILGLVASVSLERGYGRFFSSMGFAFLALVIASGIQLGTRALLESLGLREFLLNNFSLSAMLLWCGAAIPLVSGPGEPS